MILFFLLDPKAAFQASADGIFLWSHQILPALLPFSILSNLLMKSGLLSARRTARNGGNAAAFSLLSTEEWFVIFCGFLFGFPIGSKLSADLCENGLISKKRAQILCAFTNNLSPVFVSGFACNVQMKQSGWILPVFLMLYGPPLLIGLFLLAFDAVRQPESRLPQPDKKAASGFQMDMQIIDAGILNGFETLIRLCGYIVMFSVCAGMLSQCRFLPASVRLLLTGCTEVTNGIARLAQYPCGRKTACLVMMLFLSFGGLSGLAQTGSMIKRSGLSLAGYLKLKLCFVFCSMLSAACYVTLFMG